MANTVNSFDTEHQGIIVKMLSNKIFIFSYSMIQYLITTAKD